jgi:hypothetical protein
MRLKAKLLWWGVSGDGLALLLPLLPSFFCASLITFGCCPKSVGHEWRLRSHEERPRPLQVGAWLSQPVLLPNQKLNIKGGEHLQGSTWETTHIATANAVAFKVALQNQDVGA